MPAHRHTWVPYVAAAAGTCFALKAGSILASGAATDLPRFVLYLSGVLLGLVAAVGAGLRQPSTGRRIAVGSARSCCWRRGSWASVTRSNR